MTAKAKPSRRRKTEGGPNLSREIIVEAALEVIDAEGLEKFSVRVLSDRLGVFPTALYWYIPSKNEILAAVVTHVLEGVAPEAQDDWESYLRELFANFRRTIRAHPNIAPLISSQLLPNTAVSLAFVESIVTALETAGLKGAALAGGYNAVLAALVGFVAQEFAPVPTEDATIWQMQVQERLLTIDAEQYPTLAGNLPQLANKAFLLRWQNGVNAPLDDSYVFFVDMVINGIRALAQNSPGRR